MSFCFRLTLHHRTPGLFHFDTETTAIEIGNGQELLLSARNASTLSEATSFHFEGGGFPDKVTAREAGEKLRIRLRVLNAMLGLGITVPLQDSITIVVASAIKDEILEKHNVVVLDTTEGLSVFPDDGRHCESVLSMRLNVYPSDPIYIFNALTKIWNLNIVLDQRTEDALHILNLAETETSPRAKFLITYLALETLIQKESRSEMAINLLENFQQQVCQSNLDKRESDSLVGALANLRERSFSSALTEFLNRIETFKELKGRPIRKFFSECISTRNSIAHNAVIDPKINLDDLSGGIKEFMLCLIWTFNQIPSVTFDVPASSILIPEGGLTIRVV